MTTTATTTRALALDEALNVIFPTEHGFLRLEAGGHEKFFRRVEGQWRGLDERYESTGWGGPALFITLHPGETIYFNPAGFKGTALGAHIILTPRFDPERTLAVIQQHRATWLYLVPTMMTRIWRLPAEVRWLFLRADSLEQN